MSETTTITPLRERLDAAGAVFGDVAGAEVARHFGDGAGEYAAVREVAGIAARTDRARFRFWGKDPVRMIHGLVTNDVQNAPAGRGVYAAMLTPKGRTLADLRIFRREVDGKPEVLIDLAREAAEGTRDHFRKFIPPMFARWAEVTDDTAEIGIYGPRARALLSASVGSEIPAMEEDAFLEVAWREGTLLVAATREAGGEEGFDVFVPASLSGDLWDALAAGGARPVGFGALETLRIEAGRPRYGADLTEEIIPTEAFEAAGLMPRAISFSKGCYTGQEVIVRIAHRGHVNRHLRGLLLGDAPAPEGRAPLFHPETGKEIGRVTSAAWSPRWEQTVALGYVRREVAPGDAVRVGAADGAEARVAVLPFAEGHAGA